MHRITPIEENNNCCRGSRTVEVENKNSKNKNVCRLSFKFIFFLTYYITLNNRIIWNFSHFNSIVVITIVITTPLKMHSKVKGKHGEKLTNWWAPTHYHSPKQTQQSTSAVDMLKNTKQMSVKRIHFAYDTEQKKLEIKINRGF